MDVQNVSILYRNTKYEQSGSKERNRLFNAKLRVTVTGYAWGTKAIRCYRDSSVAALPKSVRVHPANHEGSAPDPWADNP